MSLQADIPGQPIQRTWMAGYSCIMHTWVSRRRTPQWATSLLLLVLRTLFLVSIVLSTPGGRGRRTKPNAEGVSENRGVVVSNPSFCFLIVEHGKLPFLSELRDRVWSSSWTRTSPLVCQLLSKLLSPLTSQAPDLQTGNSFHGADDSNALICTTVQRLASSPLWLV